jgi:carbonic anhydrase
MKLRSLAKIVLFASTLGLPITAIFSAAQEGHSSHWTYSGPEGPRHWGKLTPTFSSCSLGRMQSPIDVKNARTAELAVLKIHYQVAPLNIIDNGHTIQVNYPAGSTLTVGDKSYTLKQFHFHHPSEEHINGTSFPLVAHLVHEGPDGRLAVIAVLFELGAANPLINALWKNIPADRGKAHDVSSVSVQAQDLLPSERGYFTFAGSLTTPPCSEGVTWYVLKSRATISPEQLAAFAKIYPANVRPIQPTNGREILQSK